MTDKVVFTTVTYAVAFDYWLRSKEVADLVGAKEAYEVCVVDLYQMGNGQWWASVARYENGHPSNAHHIIIPSVVVMPDDPRSEPWWVGDKG